MHKKEVGNDKSFLYHPTIFKADLKKMQSENPE